MTRWVLLLAAATVAVVAAKSAQLPPAITLYAEEQFQGASLDLSEGAWDLAGVDRDGVLAVDPTAVEPTVVGRWRSARLRPGIHAVLYESLDRPGWHTGVFTDNIPCVADELGAHVPGAVMVEPLSGAYMCREPHLRGKCCHFPPGKYALTADEDGAHTAMAIPEVTEKRLCLSRLGRVRSLQVSPHTAVQIFANDLWIGSSKTYSAAAGEAAAIAGTFVEVDLPINSAIVSWQHNVILYEGKHYSGALHVVGPGHYPRSSIPLSRIVSVRVPVGLSATVCSRAPIPNAGDSVTDDCIKLTADWPLLASVVGLHLDHIHRLHVESECAVPCANGGKCVEHNVCKCAGLWAGPTCEIAACADVCKNGACTATNDCACVPGWQGRDCSIPICPEPCRNGGTCVRPKQCSCPPGFSGPTCAINLTAAAAAATKSPGVPEKTVRLVYDQADGAAPDTRRSTSWTASAWAAVTSGASYTQGWLRRAFLALRKGFAGSRAASADAAEKEAELVWTVEDSLLVASLMGLVLVLILTMNAVVLHRMQTTLKTKTGKLQPPWSSAITPEVRRKKAL